jgi:transposase
VLYEVKYSPELNPAEKMWQKFKRAFIYADSEAEYERIV